MQSDNSVQSLGFFDASNGHRFTEKKNFLNFESVAIRCIKKPRFCTEVSLWKPTNTFHVLFWYPLKQERMPKTHLLTAFVLQGLATRFL